MPERFGPLPAIYQRFRDWRNRGTFDEVLKWLYIMLNDQGLIDLQTWMIDLFMIPTYRQMELLITLASLANSSTAIKLRSPPTPATRVVG